MNTGKDEAKSIINSTIERFDAGVPKTDDITKEEFCSACGMLLFLGKKSLLYLFVCKICLILIKKNKPHADWTYLLMKVRKSAANERVNERT